jgi:glycosyltransferase involved in cell wall biosynthesis
MSDNVIAVIIPAHNEERVISRTLNTLLRNSRSGEFLTFVVCNGCNDETANRVRCNFPSVTVIELAEASKTAAINAGLRASGAAKFLLLDADIELSTSAARSLISALDAPAIEAAIGHMDIEDSDSSWPVQAFYRVWAHHPYLKNGKFAAVIALSRTALDRIGELPNVIADDAYLQRMIPNSKISVVDDVHFLARVPKTLPALIRVRSRVHRGNLELEHFLSASTSLPEKQHRNLAHEICKRPELWIDFLCYLAVTFASRILAAKGSQTWERDLTTRSTVS